MANVSSPNWYGNRQITITWHDYWNGATPATAYERGRMETSVAGSSAIVDVYALSDANAWQAGPDIWPSVSYTKIAISSIITLVSYDIPSPSMPHDDIAVMVVKVNSAALLTIFGSVGSYGLCYVKWITLGPDAGDIILKRVIPITVSLTNPLIDDGVYNSGPGSVGGGSGPGRVTITHDPAAELTIDDDLIGEDITEATFGDEPNKTYTYQWDDEDEREVRVVAGVNDRPMKIQVAGSQRKGDTIWRP